jgi:hypothetical protein
MPYACSHDVCEIIYSIDCSEMKENFFSEQYIYFVNTQMRGNENAPSEIKTQMKPEKEPWLFHGRLVSLAVRSSSTFVLYI